MPRRVERTDRETAIRCEPTFRWGLGYAGTNKVSSHDEGMDSMMGIPANVGIVAGGLIAAGGASAAAHFATVATTSVGDWAHPGEYAGAAGRAGSVAGGVAIPLLVGGLVAASIGAVSHGKTLAAVTKIFAEPAEMAHANLAATKAALLASQSIGKVGATRLLLGGGMSALAGVGIYAGFNSGVEMTHERLEKPALTVIEDLTVRHTMNGVKTAEENIGTLFGDIGKGINDLTGNGGGDKKK
ncbi:MAG: hypothetical protein JWN41_1800 [Thermoleophilia bacterium]|nr:hypothetical protein [Thermoleophilia bacterium]